MVGVYIDELPAPMHCQLLDLVHGIMTERPDAESDKYGDAENEDSGEDQGHND